MQALLIEDDVQVAGHVAKGLREAGYHVDQVHDGRDGLYRVAGETYDVVILDRMLPNVDGLTILQTMRASGNHTPVLIISALGEVDDRVKGLRSGGDDYLTKPFALSELLARVDALCRRGPANDVPSHIHIADLSIDLLGQEISRNGQRIELTTREFRILLYLARHAGRVVTRSMLLENVWDYHFDPQTNVIDQHVSRLRQKIDKDFTVPLIETIRGTGYKIRKS